MGRISKQYHLGSRHRSRAPKKSSTRTSTRKPSIPRKSKGDTSRYFKRYNVYAINEKGGGKRVLTTNDKIEATSWVRNRKAVNPNSKFKVVPETKKR